jgi:hypothetical protein
VVRGGAHLELAWHVVWRRMPQRLDALPEIQKPPNWIAEVAGTGFVQAVDAMILSRRV